MQKRVAILGAGSSGLTAIKACKEEGLEPVCFEWTGHTGGLWRYREDDVDGLASVMRSTIINSSKEMSSFSDFPPPAEFPNYMHNSMMIQYLDLYAKHFDLVRHVRFRHEVVKVAPAPDFEASGRWVVTLKDIEAGMVVEEVFDAVMVCTGHHVFPIVPTFPGQNQFQGTVIHTHSYKKPNGFDDRKVVVVGVGNSGGDVAVELSSVSKKVYLSTRRGCWIIHRVGPNGQPFDAAYIRRFWNCLFHTVPYSLVCYFAERKMNQRFDHATYRLKPKHRIFGQHPMVNDALPNRILSGTVTVKGNIERFTPNGIIFEGEEEETEIDTVILATGYEVKFPFATKDILWVEDNKVNLFKFVFPPHLKHPTISVIGLGQPVGALFPISELQSRWSARVFSGRCTLPSESDMKKDILAMERAMRRRYFNGPRNTLQMDWIDYMDSIAVMIDVKPHLGRLLFNDPILYWKCVSGPCLPYQYRMNGPHSWEGSRDAIISYHDRVRGALDTRKTKEKCLQSPGLLRFVLGCVMITFLAFILSVTV